jgi:chorismate mutase
MDKLLQLRENIDFIDNNILVLLKERFEILDKVKKIKNENTIPILDSKREEKIYCNIYKHFPEYYVYFKTIYEIIIKESKSYQKGTVKFCSV